MNLSNFSLDKSQYLNQLGSDLQNLQMISPIQQGKKVSEFNLGTRISSQLMQSKDQLSSRQRLENLPYDPLNALEQDLQAYVRECESPNDPGFFTVQSFGQLLIRLNILHPSDYPVEKIGIQIVQREMDLFDELWKNLKLASNLQPKLHTEFILQSMQILLDFNKPLEIVAGFLESAFQE